MIQHRTRLLRVWLLTGLLTGTCLTYWNCSGDKKESAETTTAGSDSSVFGRQGDTANNALNAPQQAPPDSADRGQIVPAEIKVTPKSN